MYFRNMILISILTFDCKFVITKARQANPADTKYMNPGNDATVSAYTSSNKELEINWANEMATPTNVNIFPNSFGSTIFDVKERNGVVCKFPSIVNAPA